MATFHSALVEYEKARLAGDSQIDEARDIAVASIDTALEAFLAAPSPSPKAFGEKMLLLESEYGLEWQPRHIASLMADVAALGARLARQ